MYRVQIWDEKTSSYFDAHIKEDNLGVTGYERAGEDFPVTEYEQGEEAVAAADQLSSATEMTTCVLDVLTGKRHFDEQTLPSREQDTAGAASKTPAHWGEPYKNTSAYRHLLGKARDAEMGGVDAWRVQSTGEKVAVALVLNRADWLELINYTMAEAVERTGAEWISILSEVERQICDERELAAEKAEAQSV